MAFKTSVEFIIAVTLLLIAISLFRQRARVKPRHLGFDLFLGGMALVAGASWMDAFDLQLLVADSILWRDSMLFVELVVGYFFGIVLVAAGLSIWIPQLAHYQEHAAARLEAERRLCASEKHLTLHVASTPLGVIEWDQAFVIRAWNPAAERIFGYTQTEALGQHVNLIFPVDERTTTDTVVHRLLAGDSVVRTRNRNRTREGRKIDCEWYSTRLVDDDEQFIGYASLVQDITEQLETETALRHERDMVQSYIDATPGLFAVFDENGRLVRWNHQLELLLGYTAAELSRLTMIDLLAHQERTKMFAPARLANVIEEGKTSTECYVLTKHGARVPLFVTAATVKTGKKNLLLIIAIDMSAKKAAERFSRASQRELEARNETLQLINRVAERLHSHLDVREIARKAVEVIAGHSGLPRTVMYLLEPSHVRLRLVAEFGLEEKVRARGDLLSLNDSLSGSAVLNKSMIVVNDVEADSTLSVVRKSALRARGISSALCLPLIYHDEAIGVISLLFGEVRDFTQKELDTFQAIAQTVSLALANAKHVEGLRHQADHDSLTGLPNRSFLHREFQRLMELKNGNGANLALLLLDLDRFKDINDTLGHHIGDQLIEQIGPRVSQTLGQALVCRLGGDEFAIVLPDLDEENQAPALSKKILTSLTLPFKVGGMSLQIGASIGVAIYPQHGHDSHALLRCADVAMYYAKRAGRGVAVYDEVFDENTPERLRLMGELRKGIDQHEFFLEYQPKISLTGGRVTGFEGLLRWCHPRLGILEPSVFMPVAEMSDLIQPLTQWVADASFAQASVWKEKGNTFTLSINLSARNLMDGRFVESLRDLKDKYEIAPETIELELTETALMHDPDAAVTLLNRIAGMGFRLSIDDFGTGYSSLMYLKRFPIQALKIDRSFVTDMLENSQSFVIVRSTVNLAHSLGLDVVAEGVEDQATMVALKDMGCDFAQGFHIARPMGEQRVEHWLNVA